MKTEQSFEKDLASIHQLMERSVKFISLSGISGILAGSYALMGAGAAYYITIYPGSFFDKHIFTVQELEAFTKLISIALVVLVASIATGLWVSARKAKRMGIEVWGAAGRHLLVKLSIPLASGGIFAILCAWQGHMEIVAASCLVFYGLALINASPNLFDEMRSLGISEITLGLVSIAVPGYSLLFWSLGFGVLHMVYGIALYKKYN